MPGHIRIRKFIHRTECRTHPNELFIFGGNMSHFGRGGQARQMRDEPNAVEIVTKRYPGILEEHYFADSDFDRALAELAPAFQKLEEHLMCGGTIVIPENGVGTERADLQKRAPKIWAYIQDCLARLHYIAHRPATESWSEIDVSAFMPRR